MAKKNYLKRTIALLLDPRVSSQKKFIFLIATSLYWVFPDFMPLIPIDDLLFTIFAAWLFSGSAQRDVENFAEYQAKAKNKEENIIDVEDYTVEDK